MHGRFGYATGESERQLLTFMLGGEHYGVDILCVQEIRRWSAVTTLPGAPTQVLGVLNLRGSIIPVVDLRLHFGLEKAEYNPFTVTIVLSVRAPTGSLEFGVVVDKVSEVVSVPAKALAPTPDLGDLASHEHILGFASIAERMVVLLDVDRLIGASILSPTYSKRTRINE